MIDSFTAKFHVQPDGCWAWAAQIDRYGYGRFKAGGIYYYAHRYAYEHLRGAIPKGLQIDHLCRNRGCVNPEHLEAVTQRENILRGDSLTTRRSAQQACKRGHLFDEANTYLWRTSRICRTCRSEQNRARYLARKAAA